MSIDYKHAERLFLYRDEQGPFRSLSVTTKAYAAYLGKLVDPEGGWLALRGRSPADAFRHNCTGFVSRSDHRLLRRAVDELLEDGYLVLGDLDPSGEFLPRRAGDYVAIRDWVPAKKGMSRREAEAWHADRDQQAARHATTRPVAARPDEAPIMSSSATQPASTVARSRTQPAPKRTRQCTDNSATSENSKGTEFAVFHTIPFHIPPLSPKGESAGADKEAEFLSNEPPHPGPKARSLAALAVSWLNEKQQPRGNFRPDSHDAVTQAKRWLAAGWDWRLVQQALELRLEALQAARPENWRNWATPGTLFNAKLRRYVDEVQAGHRYCADPPGQPRDNDASRATERTQRLAAKARQELRREAEAAFAEALEVVELVGRDGDWQRELPNARARATVQRIGWARVVTEGAAVRDEFVQRYAGGL